MTITADYNNRMIAPGYEVRIRQGVYTGYEARILSITGRRVELAVAAEIPTTVTLDRRSIERPV